VRLDPSHPMMFTAQSNLARVWHFKGEPEKAEEVYRRLIDSSTASFGRSDTRTLLLLNNLGTCLSGQGRYAEAEAVHRETFNLRLELYGPDHPQTLNAENNLAYDLVKLGRADEALELQEDVVARSLPDEPSLEGRRSQLEYIRNAAAEAQTKSSTPDTGAPR
jgi:Tfp pilus assembly protein PilF